MVPLNVATFICVVFASCFFTSALSAQAVEHQSLRYVPVSPHTSLPSAITRISHVIHSLASSRFRAATIRQQTDQNGSLLDYDDCGSSSECKPPRRCLEADVILFNTALDCLNGFSCVCLDPRLCDSAIDCDEGEECIEDTGSRFCVSVQAIQQQGLEPVPSPSADAQPATFGVNFDLCSLDSDCLGTRECIVSDMDMEAVVACSDAFVFCFCLDRAEAGMCSSQRDCDEGESCQSLVGTSLCITDRINSETLLIGVGVTQPEEELPQLVPTTGFEDGEMPQESTVEDIADSQMTEVIDAQRSPNPSAANEEQPSADTSVDDGTVDEAQMSPVTEADAVEADSGVCIAIHSLKHLHEDQLLFKRPKMARVLCDSNNSCATAGHMVSYQGQVMMMKSYCKLQRCSSALMFVNSPRFRRAMSIASNTHSLSFTAVAARYESVAEEQVLSVGVRIGLL